MILVLFIQEKCRVLINFIEDVDDDAYMLHQQQQQQQQQQQEEEIPLRAKILKTLKIQMKATLLLTLFIFKEIVFSFFAYIDLFFTSHLENFGAFVLRKLGYFRDVDYVNPQRMFLIRGTETMRGRARVTIRRTAAWFAFALLIPFVHESMMNMAETNLEITHTNIVSSFEHMWHPKKPKAIEWEAGMEKTAFSDNTTSRSPFSTPSSFDDYEAFKATEPCPYGFFSSMLPKWLWMFNPNTVLCKSCRRFIAMGGCDQSKDTLHDFALATLGSRVLTELTSPTLGDENDKGWVSTLIKKKQQDVINQRSTSSPLVALLPWTSPGECWPMAGKHGSLGVELSYPVAVKAISVDYLGQHQAVAMGSAPGDFEVWGLRKYNEGRSWKYPWDSLASVVDNDVIYLGRFMYDITKSLSVQTFELKHASPPIKAVVFRFLSNWGQDDYTCIYRVRVHGDKVA